MATAPYTCQQYVTEMLWIQFSSLIYYLYLFLFIHLFIVQLAICRGDAFHSFVFTYLLFIFIFIYSFIYCTPGNMSGRYFWFICLYFFTIYNHLYLFIDLFIYLYTWQYVREMLLIRVSLLVYYKVAMISRLPKIIGLFCRISSLL